MEGLGGSGGSGAEALEKFRSWGITVVTSLGTNELEEAFTVMLILLFVKEVYFSRCNNAPWRTPDVAGER